jgi:transcription elongation factor GreB
MTEKSNYITVEGERYLQAELNFLWRNKRPKVTRSVSEAAAQGDRSENAEYIYGKKQLREIDRRVRFLRKRLEALKVVDRIPDDQSRIFFGAWITLEDETGKQSEFRIVGPDEFDPKRGWFSIDSPMARALLGKSVDDEVTVRLPHGDATYWINAVSYSGDASQPFVEPDWA